MAKKRCGIGKVWDNDIKSCRKISPKEKKKIYTQAIKSSPKVKMYRTAYDISKTKDGDNVGTRKEVRINKPFKKNKNLYTRVTKTGKSKLSGNAWKSTYTKIGEKTGKQKSKSISKEKLVKNYKKTKKRIIKANKKKFK